MKSTPFITVEGPIGVGKTSLAKFIANHFHISLLKEIVDENPFLGKFYDNIDEWSFQTEMFFLCNRYKQLEDIEKMYLTNDQAVVADYHIFKNLIFAEQTLKNGQYDKYLEIFNILTRDMPKPNMVIYLHASLDTLLSRIDKRGREVEKNISSIYLEQLSADYQTFMETFERKHPDIPVLTFNGDELDFVGNKDDLNTIIKQIENALQKGVKSNELTKEI
ncbi:deoxynucleoside kinase [Peribacillus muralis]|uniref:deoxynucleoside kinase n=1 Tax=Peribacillus muralis TaxID=264697 RepID=UPI001F4EBD27|nr:deoxynucleoside kinase [Peribacillus muralis]MCK1995587.1 deoxynucleoside kinase [Peribacillus muralis]MCK2016143.1 deoxynucleoside kinase [Peribacillus muralis]